MQSDIAMAGSDASQRQYHMQGSGARAQASNPQSESISAELAALREQSHVSRRQWQQSLALTLSHMLKLDDGSAADVIGFTQSSFQSTSEMLLFMRSMLLKMQENGTLLYKHTLKAVAALDKGDSLIPEYTLDMQPRKLYVVSDSVLNMGKGYTSDNFRKAVE